jgi:hypothetical protein
MPDLAATLRVDKQEDVAAAEFALTVTFTNNGSEPQTLNTSQASHPALVLDVRDRNGEHVLLPPPSAPGAEDLAPGELIPPGGSVSVTYAGFLNRDLKPGEYRVRYYGEFPALGGTPDDPLRSDWLTFTVRRARGYTPGIEIPGIRKPSPDGPLQIEPRIPGFLVPILDLLRRWWCVIYCAILRYVLGRKCGGVRSQEFDQALTETISNAPPGSEAWNGTYGWNARFLLTFDETNCRVGVQVRVRLVGTITTAQRAAWETAIEAAWNNRFKLCCGCCCCREGLPIVCDIQFVTSNEHQVVNVATSTTNMGNWGASDTTAVSHEFGHMLGARDEYFTVDGVNWGNPQPGGGIMNFSSDPTFARHYELIRASASTLGSACSIRPQGQSC